MKTDDTQEQLNEFKLTWAGKLFFASAAAWIAGSALKEKNHFPIKVKGSPRQMEAMVNALVASKMFQQELKRPGATPESVMKKMNIRNMTKDRFFQICGKQFPL